MPFLGLTLAFGAGKVAAFCPLFWREPGARQTTGGLVQGIMADVPDTRVFASKALAGLDAILAAFRFAREAAVQASQLFEVLAQGFGVLNRHAI